MGINLIDRPGVSGLERLDQGNSAEDCWGDELARQ